jgi:hypothetical protein
MELLLFQKNRDGRAAVRRADLADTLAAATQHRSGRAAGRGKVGLGGCAAAARRTRAASARGRVEGDRSRCFELISRVRNALLLAAAGFLGKR